MLVYRRLEAVTSSGDRILDVGTKTGEYLTEIKADCVGIDLDVEPSNGSIEYANADGAALPFCDSAFDYVVSNMVFEHVPHSKKQPLVNEVARVLKPAGEFLIAFPNRLTPMEGHNLPLRTLYLPRRVLVPLSSHLLERDEYYQTSIHNISSIGARRMLERAFKTVKFETIDLAAEYGKDNKSWQPIEAFLPALEKANRTPVKRLIEWSFPYSSFRCSSPTVPS